MKLNRLCNLLGGYEIPKVLMIRGPGLGDVLMLTPTMRALKQLVDFDCHLTLATDFSYLNGAIQDLLKYNPDIDSLMDMRNVNPEKFDVVLDFQNVAQVYEGQQSYPVNRIDLYARHAELEVRNKKPVFVFSETDLSEPVEEIVTSMKPKILVQPEGSTMARAGFQRALREAVIKLGQFMDIYVATYGSERGNWDSIYGVREIHQASIRKVARIMKQVNLVLCPDSSFLHLAGALDVPTVGLFGPTHPSARVNHYPKAIAIWGGAGMAACPCWYNTCPIQHACWGSITPDLVVDTVYKHLEGEFDEKNPMLVR